MREHDRGVWICSRDSCNGVVFGRNAVRPICPVHYRRMERLGGQWLCPEGCSFPVPWESIRSRDAAGKAGIQDQDGEDESPRPLVIKRRGGRRRSRYPSPLKRRWLEWLRRRGRQVS